MKNKITNPLISIIMNCHNGEKYLKKSLKSIFRQKYKNWELIFWDNCSTDNSKKIIKSYQLKDKRIKYFKHYSFTKLYQARNLALKKTNGDYVSFLDTDDWWHNERLMKQVEVLRKNNEIKFIYSKYLTYNQTKKKLFNNFKSRLESGFVTKKLLKKYLVGIVTVLIKKDLLEKNQFNEEYNIIGDFDLFMNLSLKIKFYAIQQPLAYYRLHSENYSNLNLKEYISELKYWIKNNKKKYEKIDISLIYPWLKLKKLQIESFFAFR